MTPAERLLAAADLLDKRAGEATGGPWEVRFTGLARPTVSVVGEILERSHGSAATTVFAGVDEDRADSGNLDESEINWVSEKDAAYIATMHPEVGKEQAAWLRESAADLIDTPGTWTQHTLCARFIGHPDEGNRCRHYDPALRLADLILAGAS